MAALTDIYVDPSLDSNTGAGTIGDPYGDLQWALNVVGRRDATHGNQINIKAGDAEVLTGALDFTEWGAPTAISPTVFRGYQTTKNDGLAKAIINGGGGQCVSSTTGHLHFRDIEFRNGGSATLVAMPLSSSLINCKISDTSGTGVACATNDLYIVGNEITDCDVGIAVTGGRAVCQSNYLKAGGIRNFTIAIRHAVGAFCVYERNIISVGTSGNGISLENSRSRLNGNSILAAGSTGSGVDFTAATRGAEATIINNVVEGFSGEGGSGFNFLTATSVPLRYAGNAAYGNDEDYRNPGDIGIADDTDNEVLDDSPFAKSGADTFANRFAYFSPTTEGNIRGGAIQ